VSRIAAAFDKRHPVPRKHLGAIMRAEGIRLDKLRPLLALYVGGMGTRKQNFYHQLVTRYGFGTAADETLSPTYPCMAFRTQV
jgi:hypothetical protein